jgi:hypothetical protein
MPRKKKEKTDEEIVLEGMRKRHEPTLKEKFDQRRKNYTPSPLMEKVIAGNEILNSVSGAASFFPATAPIAIPLNVITGLGSLAHDYLKDDISLDWDTFADVSDISKMIGAANLQNYVPASLKPAVTLIDKGFDNYGRIGDVFDTLKTMSPFGGMIVTEEQKQEQEDMKKVPQYKYGGRTKYAMGGKSYAAMDGQVPIEVESGEFLQPPFGGGEMVTGNTTHAQGGVDVTVPGGTQIFSDRISIDGKTLAQRAATRDKSRRRLSKNQTDVPGKNTLSRLLEEEKLDTAITQIASQANPPGKAPWGTDGKYYPNQSVMPQGVGLMPEIDRIKQGLPESGYDTVPIAPPPLAQRAQGPQRVPIQTFYGTDADGTVISYDSEEARTRGYQEGTSVHDAGVTTQYRLPGPPKIDAPIYKDTAAKIKAYNKANPDVKTTGMDLGSGGGFDMGGSGAMSGTMVGAASSLVGLGLQYMVGKDAIKDLSRRNKNNWEDYGNWALREQRGVEQQAYANHERAKNDFLREQTIAANTARRSVRQGAQSMNTLRAGLGITEEGIGRNITAGHAGLNSNFGQQLLQLGQQKVNLAQDIDRTRRTGQDAYDERMRQIVGDYYSNMSELSAGLSNIGQSAGNTMNTMYTQKQERNLINEMSPYFDVSKLGILSNKPTSVTYNYT